MEKTSINYLPGVPKQDPLTTFQTIGRASAAESSENKPTNQTQPF